MCSNSAFQVEPGIGGGLHFSCLIASMTWHWLWWSEGLCSDTHLHSSYLYHSTASLIFLPFVIIFEILNLQPGTPILIAYELLSFPSKWAASAAPTLAALARLILGDATPLVGRSHFRPSNDKSSHCKFLWQMKVTWSGSQISWAETVTSDYIYSFPPLLIASSFSQYNTHFPPLYLWL